MRVAIGSDKSGFALKEAVKAYLVSEEARAAGIEFDSGRDDLGTTDIGDVHPYYRVAADVAPRVLSGEYDRAVLRRRWRGSSTARRCFAWAAG